MEKWELYMEIRQLKKQGFKVSQIARKLGVARGTVYDYLDRTPDEMADWLAGIQERKKKLDPYHEEILSWVKEHRDISAAQVLDWLEERHGDMAMAESTVRGYVSQMRERYNLPKVLNQRQYEAIPDPPMGQQVQVDFGQTKQDTSKKDEIKLHFISFVLSNSRYKAVFWLDRPFTTKDVIRAHEDAFEQFGGMPEELVYDQDSLILVNENAGNLIFTAEFQAYREERGFRVHMCKKSDPESKGRIENVIGFVKKNFAKSRIFDNIDKWNEQCQAWLKRTGNGKVHNTTKKRPVEVFQKEKQHLRPIQKKIELFKNDKSSIARTVNKDNTIRYKGNRYSVPFGTYKYDESNPLYLSPHDGKLIITNVDGEVIADHDIDHRRGQLIQARNHRRDRSKGIDTYIESLSNRFGDSDQATSYINDIRKAYPRYIRDHLQMISKVIGGEDQEGLDRALTMCVENRLYSGQDFRDVFLYLKKGSLQPAETVSDEIKEAPLDAGHFKQYQPEMRGMTDYINILKGGVPDGNHPSS